MEFLLFDGGRSLLVCYGLVAELLFEFRYSPLGLGQLALRVFLLLFQVLILCYHVFGVVPDGGEFSVNFDQGRIQRRLLSKFWRGWFPSYAVPPV